MTDPSIRRRVWDAVAAEIADFPQAVRDLPVTPDCTVDTLRSWLAAEYSFAAPVPLDRLATDVIEHLRAGIVQVTSPRYFGLFNPSVREAGVVADTLVALYNPQLAAYSHAPAECEMERHTLRHLAGLLGFDPDATHATFTSGGAESNLSAVLTALAHLCPEAAEAGVASLGRRPAIYLSAEGHHSFVKAARMTGLGTGALRLVPTTGRLALDAMALDAQMRADAQAGWHPLLVIGTAGTTSAGVVDPLSSLADVAAAHGAWFHVDAAWGGSAALSPRLRPVLAGISRADSVTWDAHKWLSVPMGAGMFFCRHREAVERAFGVSTSYMPGALGADTPDPYATTAQWSRRAIGLKVFMALAELGTAGCGALIEQQAEMGELLRARLREAGWLVVNDTPLPVVCFTNADIRTGRFTTGDVVRAISERRRVWISDVVLGQDATGNPATGERVLRACITSFRTDAGDVECLVEELKAVWHAGRLHPGGLGPPSAP
ncbi:MAG: aminotransferase class V-fold PLP-dependent enzyme [Blastocatellia bacterium]|nr:aminotransferase class V-fold PLP-dependent enzyme [Blastocatellia bacterium]